MVVVFFMLAVGCAWAVGGLCAVHSQGQGRLGGRHELP